jgi:hypothetical protein
MARKPKNGFPFHVQHFRVIVADLRAEKSLGSVLESGRT